MNLKLIISLILELTSLIKLVFKTVKDAETRVEQANAAKDIKDAFKNRDASKLNDVFNKLRK
jgi:hypothetical protein